MKGIVVAEYLNYIDTEGNPVGHGKKVLDEAVRLIGEDNECTCMAGREYLSDKAKLKRELYSVCPGKTSSSQLMRAKIKNIRTIIRNAKGKIIWFTNVDWILLAYLATHRVKNSIIVTMYRNVVEDMAIPGTKLPALKKHLVLSGLRKIKFAVVTNPNLRFDIPQINIPDYYYDERYSPFLSEVKKPVITCLGAMRESKELVKVVQHFKNTDVIIRIIGGFANQDYYEKVIEEKCENIQVENRRIGYTEYYSLVASSEFMIMPYDMRFYQHATSGILLETVFLDSIPIAPKEILKENNVNGIAYEKISDLPKSYNELHLMGMQIKNDKSRYAFDSVRDKLMRMIEQTC